MNKKLLLITILYLCSLSFYGQKKKKNTEKDLVLALNAIVADQNHYSKAVLEYKLIKEILKGNSVITQLLIADQPKLFLNKKCKDSNTQDEFLIKTGNLLLLYFLFIT
ncbi:hypothetical protein [Aquimarina aggregata]|uniref:hypothetical protein n=1 Tax=Aquimarina aggregata TaxID=1642818 RepID=UPI002492FE49|nr:hypothetical protein [Aquimarina aggregata]